MPGLRAECPACGESVIAKCGSINQWHWAHEIKDDCDQWSEGETQWHRAWKEHFPEECREVVIGPHRADIKTRRGTVVELQHSPISGIEIQHREYFYRQMVWVFDASDFGTNFQFRRRDGFFSFRWKHPRKSMWSCESRLLIELDRVCAEIRHLPSTLFEIKKTHNSVPCGGWGVFVDKHSFITELADG